MYILSVFKRPGIASEIFFELISYMYTYYRCHHYYH